MLSNYFKIAFRNILRYKGYSFINILGLGIGIAAYMMISLWVQDEKSYENFNHRASRIYRVELQWDFREMHGQGPITAAPFGPTLYNDYPEIENFTRIQKIELPVKDFRNTFRKKKMLIADYSLFDVMQYHLKEGDPATALKTPRSVVMTRENALKYLGAEEVVGQTVTMEWEGQPVDFLVTGILDELPVNSHITFDMVISLSTHPADKLTAWFESPYYTYLLLKQGTSLNDLEAKFPSFLSKYLIADFVAFFGPNEDINKVYQIKLRPLSGIHLNPSRHFEIEPQGNASTVYIFSVIAAMILIIACINFMNLSTARANKRSLEVGMRKTIGAAKQQLWFQFLGESMIYSFAALLIAVLIMELTIPLFNSISGKNLSAILPFKGLNPVILLGITFISGFLSGIYPSFYLSAFEPIKVLKGSAAGGSGKSIFRTVTAVIQFVISITLIIGTFVIYMQMNYIHNKSLGFDKENIVVISTDSEDIRQNVEAFKNVLKKDPNVISVSASSNVPGNRIFYDTNFKRSDTEDVFNLLLLDTDYDFSKTYNLDIINGRSFSRDFGTDQNDAFLLNRKAVETLGYTPEEAIGKELLMTLGPDNYRKSKIVGVVEDFHFYSLKSRMNPLAILLTTEESIRFISVKIAPGDVRQTMKLIEQNWAQVFPGRQFEYRFLDSQLNLLYANEEKMQKIFMIFSVLSVFVACLGLFGLAAYTAEERTKEIGIRKVMGATVSGVVLLLSREFTRWVVIANLFAWPLGWFVMNKWLQNFAYKTTLAWWIFFLSGGIALIIAILTVSSLAVKAAVANPVESLKYE